MSAGRMCARADLRARPVSVALLILLVGLTGAVAITSLAAGRRTDSAYARYREAASEPEALVFSCPNGFPAPRTDLEAAARLPQVASHGTYWNAFANAYDAAGTPLFYRRSSLEVSLIAAENAASVDAFHPKLLAGRYPQGPGEAAVAWGETNGRRPEIGEVVRVEMVKASAPDNDIRSFHLPPAAFFSARLEIVGEILNAGELNGESSTLVTTRAFADQHHDDAWACMIEGVQLRRGLDDIAPFPSRLQRIDQQALSFDMSTEAAYAERSTHLTAIVLRLFAVLAAIAGLLILGQILVRRTLLGSTDVPILRALGMTRREMLWAALLPGVVVGLGASLVAVSVSVGVSGLFPTGVARLVEPDPGIALDPLALGLGVAAIVFTTLVCAGVPAWRMASAAGGVEGAAEYAAGERRSRVASALLRLGMPVTAVREPA